MAVDSKAKRFSATQFLFPGYTQSAVPSGTVDRLAAAWMYVGIAAGSGATTAPTPAADSIRRQILSATVTALRGITKANGYQTDVKYVSETYTGYETVSKSKLPACFPIDTDEERSWEALEDTSTTDMRAELTILVTSVVHDPQNVTRLQRTNLLRDVEKALLNNAALGALIHEIEPQSVVTDKGTIPNFSIFDQEFIITYFYNSAVGG